MKEQDKASEIKLNEMEISNMPEKTFKVMIIKMLTGLEKRMEELSKSFNKKMENIKELIRVEDHDNGNKSTLEGINSTLADAE